MNVIGRAALRQAVSMEKAIDAVRDAFIGAARGEFGTVPRSVLPSHTLFAMTAERIVGGRNLGQVVKIFTYHEDNSTRSLPMLQGLVLFFDGVTGLPKAIIDAAEVTALRTGAAAGVATDLLALRDARRLAIIGTGALAEDQARAVCAVRPTAIITVAARDFDKTKRFVRELESKLTTITVRACETVAEAVADADVICTATTSRTPLLDRNHIKTNVHINAMGAFTPEMCELAPDVITGARTIAIDDPAAMQACGELAHLEKTPPTLGALLTQPPAAPAGGITIFKSIGISPQDWAVAQLVAAQRF